MRELAVAGGSVDLGARKPDRRIYRAEGGDRHAAVLFLQISLEIVAQAIIHGQPLGNLPAILRVKPKAMSTRLGLGVRTDFDIVHQAQHKAGVTEAGGIGEVERLKILPGIGGFGIVNTKGPISPPSAFLGISVDDE